MALKNWRRTQSGSFVKKNNKNERILLYPSPQAPKDIFYVYVDDKDNTIEKRFKNKSQALAFAKKYMRSH